MLTHNRIKLFDLHLVWHGFLVLAGRVVVPGPCRGNQLNLVSHLFTSLDLLTFGSHGRDDQVDAFLVDNTHAFGRNAQLYKPVFAFNPKLVVMDIRRKTSLGAVIRMRNIVTAYRSFTGYLTYLGHVIRP
jgi:hypothetical protein